MLVDQEVQEVMKFEHDDRLAIEGMEKDGSIILVLSGEVDWYTKPTYVEAVLWAETKSREIGTNHIELDLSSLAYGDTSLLYPAMGLLKRIRGDGGEVVFTNPPSHIQRILRATKLDSIFSASKNTDVSLN